MSDDQQSQVNTEVEEKGHYGQAKKDMETVHSYFEESSQQVDQNKLHKALDSITESKKELTSKTDKELAMEKVTVAKEDLELIIKEFEITKLQADKVLRECGGDVIAAMTRLVNT